MSGKQILLMLALVAFLLSRISCGQSGQELSPAKNGSINVSINASLLISRFCCMEEKHSFRLTKSRRTIFDFTFLLTSLSVFPLT